MRKLPEITKRGTTGNSGFGVDSHFIHMAISYDANGCYFVPCQGEREWRRVKKTPANRKKAILCSFPGCNKPATSLDHYYPYYNDRNSCDKHLKR